MNEGGVPDTVAVDEKALGRAIGVARKNAGLTQQQLCEQLDISYSALTKIERGAIKAPSVFTVAQIARICNVSIESLLDGSIPAIATNDVQQPKADTAVAKNGVRFVYFDINGCMVRFFQRAFTQLATEANVSPEVIEETFWHYNDAVCRGEMSMVDFNHALAERIHWQSVDWMHYYLDAVDPITEVHECARWVAEQGFRFGLMSNIMPGFIDAMMQRGLLPTLPYTTIIDSSVVRSIKPETAIYEVAGQKSETRAEDILLVDDSRTNLMAAERLGWHVLWFDDFRPTESVERIKLTLAR